MNVKTHECAKRALTAMAVACAVAAGPLALAGDDAAITKDLHISQTPMATGIQPPTGRPEEAALSVRASVDRGNEGAYRAGEKVRLAVEVSEAAYVWVYDTGTSGKVHRIFPNAHEQDNLVRPGAPVSIPGPDAEYDFEVSHPRGTELLTVIATTSDRPLDSHLLQTAVPGGQSGPFLALAGDAASVAKDLSISLKKEHPAWAKAVAAIRIE